MFWAWFQDFSDRPSGRNLCTYTECSLPSSTVCDVTFLTELTLILLAGSYLGTGLSFLISTQRGPAEEGWRGPKTFFLPVTFLLSTAAVFLSVLT